MDTARNRVFATEELFEEILSFLPLKNLFYIRRVSKRWAGVINGSVTLQQKMFLRPRDQPELWVVDKKHKLGAHSYRKKYKHLNDTELRFRRIKAPIEDGRLITPVTLNPILKDDNNTVKTRSNIFRMAIECDFEVATYCGWMDALWDQDNSNTAANAANASFWNTFLTDPPCHKVDVQRFAFRLDDTQLPVHPSSSHPVVAATGFSSVGGLPIESNTGVRMRDVLLPYLTARGFAHGGGSPPRWLWKQRDATIRDAVEAMKQEVGSECVAKRWALSFRLRLYKVGDAQPLLATDEDRAAANVGWK